MDQCQQPYAAKVNPAIKYMAAFFLLTAFAVVGYLHFFVAAQTAGSEFTGDATGVPNQFTSQSSVFKSQTVQAQVLSEEALIASDSPAAISGSHLTDSLVQVGSTLKEECAATIQGYLCSALADSKDSSLLSADGSGTAGLSGMLVSTVGMGLANVEIVVAQKKISAAQPESSGKLLRYKTRTDELGHFRLEGLPAGLYSVRSSGSGEFQPAQVVARSGAEDVALVARHSTPMVVEGVVTTEFGEPLEGVAVVPAVLGQPSVHSNADGHYRLIFALNQETSDFSVRYQRPGYREQVYRLVKNPELHEQISMAPVVMRPVELWSSISGRILDTNGYEVSGVPVELRRQSAAQRDKVITDEEGRFSFPVIEAPAEYRLTVLGGSKYHDLKLPLETSATSPEQTANMELVVEPYDYGDLSGRIVNSNGAPVSNLELVLRNEMSRDPAAVLRTDENGNFAVTSVPAGKIVLSSESDPAFLVQGVGLVPGQNTSIPLTLDWGSHQLRGTVVDAYGNPVAASSVTLRWSQESEGITALSTRRTVADAQGHFAFNNLGPGPHSLQIKAPGRASIDVDHDLIRQGYLLTVRLN
jgi:hypothetical protein